jgi:hypothetical protein
MEEDERPANGEQEIDRLRYTQLRWLLMASLANTGLFTILYALGLLSVMAIGDIPYEEFEAMFLERVEAMADPEALPAMLGMVQVLHQSGVALMSLLLGRTVLRLYGVVQMYKGRRQGFHIYAIAQLAGIFAPHLVLPLAYMGLWGPLAAVAMTALYGSQVKHIGE